MLRYAPAALLYVVDRDVLKEARDRIKPQTATLVEIGEAKTAPGRVRPPALRNRSVRIQHARTLRACSPGGPSVADRFAARRQREAVNRAGGRVERGDRCREVGAVDVRDRVSDVEAFGGLPAAAAARAEGVDADGAEREDEDRLPVAEPHGDSERLTG